MKSSIPKRFSWIVFFLFMALHYSFAQDKPNEKPLEKVSVTMESGNKFIGEIVQQSQDSVVLKTENLGTITLLHKNIKKVVFIKTQEKLLERVTITMKNGNKFTGDILQQFQDSVIIKNESLGEVTILNNDIKKVVFIKTNSLDEISDNKISAAEIKSGINPSWFRNPSPNYYLLGGNAISSKKGQWAYQNGMVTYNALSYGVTNNVSVKFSSFLAWVDPNLIIHPRITVPVVNNFHLGFGSAFVITRNGWGSFLQATATLGNKDRNLSLTFGYAYIGNEGFLNAPIVSISGIYRISERVALMTENWYVNSNDLAIFELGIATYGVRIFLKNLSIDAMLANNREIAGFFVLGVPLVSVSVPFGKR